MFRYLAARCRTDSDDQLFVSESLREAGLKRITVSLDSINEAVFQRMNGVGFPASLVLDGIVAALRAGFASVKANMVVKRGVNDTQILSMARHFRGTGVEVRFIEFMDVGMSNGWNMELVVPSNVLESSGEQKKIY